MSYFPTGQNTRKRSTQMKQSEGHVQLGRTHFRILNFRKTKPDFSNYRQIPTSNLQPLPSLYNYTLEVPSHSSSDYPVHFCFRPSANFAHLLPGDASVPKFLCWRRIPPADFHFPILILVQFRRCHLLAPLLTALNMEPTPNIPLYHSSRFPSETLDSFCLDHTRLGLVVRLRSRWTTWCVRNFLY
jgi:hypothetical protein